MNNFITCLHGLNCSSPILYQGAEVRIEAHQRAARSLISFYELSETRRSSACIANMSDCG